MTYKHFRLIYNAKFSYNNHFQKLMVSIRRKNACGKRHTYESIDFFYLKEASKNKAIQRTQYNVEAVCVIKLYHPIHYQLPEIHIRQKIQIRLGNEHTVFILPSSAEFCLLSYPPGTRLRMIIKVYFRFVVTYSVCIQCLTPM